MTVVGVVGIVGIVGIVAIVFGRRLVITWKDDELEASVDRAEE
jgi:hypothetical protein